MHIIRLLALITVLAVIAGCSGSSTNPGGSKEVTITSLLKEAGLGENITEILLTISGEGFETITHELEIVDGVATITTDVPIGEDRTFEMTAFNNTEIALYSGSAIADVFTGVITEVDIKMEPLVPMIRVSPMFSEIGIEENKSISIFVHNVDSLFGASCRLEYDTALVEVVSVVAGNIFAGKDALFFTQTRPGYVAVAYSIKGNQSAQGVSIDGTIAVITIAGKAAGTSSLGIPQETLSLIDWQGNSLPREEVLFIEEGEIRIDAP